MDLDEIYRKLKELVPEESRLLRNADMRDYTTFRIGGPADFLVRPASEKEMAGILGCLRGNHIPYTVMGNGSNILVLDGGIRGVVIRVGRDMAEISVERDCVTAGAGALLSAVSSAAASAGLTGMEFAAGIPGSVGGAIFMNAGAYGGEMSQILVSCRALLPDGTIREFGREEMKLGYRRSVFAENGGIILSCTMRLAEGRQEEILARMKDLAARRTEKAAAGIFPAPAVLLSGPRVILPESSSRKPAAAGSRRVEPGFHKSMQVLSSTKAERLRKT